MSNCIYHYFRIMSNGMCVYMVIVILLLLIVKVSAQPNDEKLTVSGFIKDAKSGEALIGATVFDEYSEQGTVSNAYGFYSLTLMRSRVSLRYSYVGYQNETIEFQLDEDTVVSMEMNEGAVLQEVVIESEKEKPIHEISQTSIVEIPIKQIQYMPAFNGEVDVLKSLQLVPGVKAGNEGNAGIYVRGGGLDQNLILVDGVPVYNATHLYGFYSIFNADAINTVTLLKGGFPARYGGRLSSVVDINMKDGNMNQLHGIGSVGLITVKGLLEGPIIKDKISFMTSGRTSHFDPFLAGGFEKGRHEDVKGDGFRFYDFNFKVNYKINAKNRLYISGYMGQDESSTVRDYLYEDSISFYKQKITSRIQWGNQTGSIRWNHVFTKKVFSSLALSYNRYDFQVTEENNYISQYQTRFDTTNIKSQFDSGIEDMAFNYGIEYIPDPNHHFRLGFEGIKHTYTPGIRVKETNRSAQHESPQVERERPTEFSVYLEDDFSITQLVKTNIGVRYNNYMVDSRHYTSFQPRASVRLALSDRMSLKTSYSMMQQNVHLLTTAGLGLPTDLWLPATEKAPPLQSHQFVLGAATQRRDLEITAEVYYKRSFELIAYKNGASYLDSDESWEDLIEKGRGESYGFEWMVQKKTGRLNGWLGYTLSWTNRQFDNLSQGEWFPYRYDSRHDFKVVGIYKLSERLSLSGNWIFRTGNAVTLPTQAYYNDFFHVDYYNLTRGDNYQYEYDERNNFRMRSYHRLDLSANFTIQKEKLKHSISASIYNVYNRLNPYFLEYGYRIDVGKVLVQKSLLGIVPSINYAVSF
ncbi:MAG: TonB-dependent receptor [Cyclobacteriaceae bacterium]